MHIFKYSSFFFRLKITVGCLRSTYPSIHSFTWEGHAQDHGRLPDENKSKHSHEKTRADSLQSTVGAPPCNKTKHAPVSWRKALSRSRLVARGAHIQAFSEKLALTLEITVGCPRRAQIQAFAFLLVKALSGSRSVARRAREHVRRNHLVWTPFEAIALPFHSRKEKIKKTFFLYNQGNLGRTHRTKTHSTKTTAQENRTHVTTDMWDMFF